MRSVGKQDNCQVEVTLSLANHDASLPIAYRLYLPEDWGNDRVRRHKAKIPEAIAFQTKPVARQSGLEASHPDRRATILPISGKKLRSITAGTRCMGAGFDDNISSGARSVKLFMSKWLPATSWS